jgi:hypothetical protein
MEKKRPWWLITTSRKYALIGLIIVLALVALAIWFLVRDIQDNVGELAVLRLVPLGLGTYAAIALWLNWRRLGPDDED